LASCRNHNATTDFADEPAFLRIAYLLWLKYLIKYQPPPIGKPMEEVMNKLIVAAVFTMIATLAQADPNLNFTKDSSNYESSRYLPP
jgi:hypothetical protein